MRPQPNTARARRSRAPLALGAIVLLTVCQAATERPRPDARGSSADVARLAPDAQAAAYTAALRTSFDLGPSLDLLLDERMLPATGGYEGGAPVAPALLGALRERGTVRGACGPVRRAADAAPRCDVERAGYAVRVSDVFRASGDTVRLYITAERVQPASDSSFVKAFAFEGRYLLVPAKHGWTVVRAARRMIS